MGPELFKRRPGLWLVALLLVAAIVFAIWWKLSHWKPEAADFPVQGVWLTGREGDVAIAGLPGDGASFVYATASRGGQSRNDRFAETVEAARKAGMQAGAVHVYDPCLRADLQSANFVTVVPRDGDLLAPAVVLTGSGEDCRPRVRPAELESELVVFLNQIEMHAARRAILAPSPAFEAEYGFGAKAERKLWLARDWLQPDYAGRPWTLWSANRALRIGAADTPVAWIAARP